MEFATLIVLLALVQFFYFTARVGLTRRKYNIQAPACQGNDTWERLARIQQNTMEQLVLLIPATFAFAYYLSPVWVVLPGAAFIFGRFLYSSSYLKDPKKRGPGMLLTGIANLVMLVGALFGVLLNILS